MVFQEPLLFDSTVFENVASGLKIRGMKREDIRRKAMEQLDRFGIGHLSHRSARKISGGRHSEQVLPGPLRSNQKSFFSMSRLLRLILQPENL